MKNSTQQANSLPRIKTEQVWSLPGQDVFPSNTSRLSDVDLPRPFNSREDKE